MPTKDPTDWANIDATNSNKPWGLADIISSDMVRIDQLFKGQ
jgi:hypothetical protein